MLCPEGHLMAPVVTEAWNIGGREGGGLRLQPGHVGIVIH